MKEAHEFLEEDVGAGDITTQALGVGGLAEAVILAKADCIVAGVGAARDIFTHLGLKVRHLARDGDRVRAGTAVMEVDGPADALLKGERLALNFLMRLSGIATATRELTDVCGAVNPGVKVAATRKTSPGLRKWEKGAVEAGGGMRHREGLYDQYLIKDNHLKLVGSITRAVERARAHGKAKVVEVEVTDPDGAEEAARAGADIVMLDNMPPEMAAEAAARVRAIKPDAAVEVSGGINPDNILQYAGFADVISLGWLTHSVRAVDFSLEIISIVKPATAK